MEVVVFGCSWCFNPPFFQGWVGLLFVEVVLPPSLVAGRYVEFFVFWAGFCDWSFFVLRSVCGSRDFSGVGHARFFFFRLPACFF